MNRPSFVYRVPQEWQDRMGTGLCPVCSKPKAEWDKNKRLYCSEKCKEEYNSKIIFWGSLRTEILKRDNFTCTECHRERDVVKDEIHAKLRKKEDEEIKKIVSTLEILDFLKAKRDEKLIELENKFKRDYDELMNFTEFVRDMKHELKEEFKIELPSFDRLNWFDVLEVDHIKAIVNDGDMWDTNNLRTLCIECHKKKTKKDLAQRVTKGNSLENY